MTDKTLNHKTMLMCSLHTVCVASVHFICFPALLLLPCLWSASIKEVMLHLCTQTILLWNFWLTITINQTSPAVSCERRLIVHDDNLHLVCHDCFASTFHPPTLPQHCLWHIPSIGPSSASPFRASWSRTAAAAGSVCSCARAPSVNQGGGWGTSTNLF